jgi:glycyl-tRNA synthetase alpha chain
MTTPTYQTTIARLQAYWEAQGCVVVQPYHTEVGAGTFNPATFLRCLDARPGRAAFGEPSTPTAATARTRIVSVTTSSIRS